MYGAFLVLIVILKIKNFANIIILIVRVERQFVQKVILTFQSELIFSKSILFLFSYLLNHRARSFLCSLLFYLFVALISALHLLLFFQLFLLSFAFYFTPFYSYAWAIPPILYRAKSKKGMPTSLFIFLVKSGVIAVLSIIIN